MNIRSASPTRLALALVLVAACASRAQAMPILWSLSDVTFSDGGTASGSFVFDVDTGIITDLDVTTTGGSVLPGHHYLDAGGFAPYVAAGFVENDAVPTGSNDP